MPAKLGSDTSNTTRCTTFDPGMSSSNTTRDLSSRTKIGAYVVRHTRAITFQLAEVAVSGPMVRAILDAICRLRAPPLYT
ncbi:MAG: hypothetical protein II336_20655 [Loktanella sp.]|nr:hypothetical protein [Loktanella sp.]